MRWGLDDLDVGEVEFLTRLRLEEKLTLLLKVEAQIS